MACQAVQMWSLSGLVAAFLDLAIAYLLLCGSAVAYLASKFLGFFGLNLPCPCDGMFVNIHCKSFCFDRLLIDFPTHKVSEVQFSVKQKFPFNDSRYSEPCDCRFVSDNNDNGILEIEGEASCSSLSDARRSVDVVRRDLSSRTGKYDVKGKGVLIRRRSRRLRDQGWVGDPPLPEEVLGGEPYSHFGTKKKGTGFIDGSFLPTDNAETYYLEYDNNPPKKLRGRHRAVTNVEMDLSPEEDMHIKRTIQSFEEKQDNQQDIRCFDGDEKNTIRLLEEKLEEEHIARAALYIELEKERSAAATAADEAMAMILRLQEEKASIEMEARQYQRMIEEKSSYDAEEMIILKEILLRREKEKHFLEKEVEAYRQMVSIGNEQLAGDGSDNSDAGRNFGLLLDPNDDPVLILHQLSAFSEKRATIEDKPNCRPDFEPESPIYCHDGQSNFEKNQELNENSVKIPVCNRSMELQEKEIIFADKNAQLAPKPPLECQKTTPLQTEELDQVQENRQGHKLAGKIIGTCNGNEAGHPNSDQHPKQQEKDTILEFGSSCDPMFDKDTHVYDIHIISDGTDFCNEATEDKSSSLQFYDINSVPSTSRLETEGDIKRSSSEISCGLPPIGPRGSSLVSDLRRSSTAAMNNEMLKIDSEIGRLREQLILVREGREKLGFPLENRERENVQLKLLEDIARQVQEIRRLTEPGKAPRQVSLPLQTSKVLSKKRRSRSVSSGLQMSSEG